MNLAQRIFGSARPARRLRRVAFSVFSLLIFAFAARILFGEFHTLRWAAIQNAILQWRGRFPLAVVLCASSFMVVGVIEWRGLRWAGSTATAAAALRVSFIANGFAHSLSAPAVVAGAVRARLYARYDVTVSQAAAVTAFQAATSGLGFAAFVGLSCLDGSGGPATRVLGAAALGGLTAYLVACAFARGTICLWGHAFSLPNFQNAVIQICLGALDNGLAIAALWVLLPQQAVAFTDFAANYVVAYLGGALSGVPGGAGAFEGVIVKLLPHMDRAGIGAALLGFRLIFNLLPLAGAAILFPISLFRARNRTARD